MCTLGALCQHRTALLFPPSLFTHFFFSLLELLIKPGCSLSAGKGRGNPIQPPTMQTSRPCLLPRCPVKHPSKPKKHFHSCSKQTQAPKCSSCPMLGHHRYREQRTYCASASLSLSARMIPSSWWTSSVSPYWTCKVGRESVMAVNRTNVLF